MHARVRLHFPDERPVGIALVHLAAGAAVDGKGGDAGVLQTLGQLHDDLRALVPSQACLHGHRFADGFDNRPGDGDHLIGLAHHPAAGSAPGYLRDRAADVDVDEVSAVAAGDFRRAVGHPGRVHHGFGQVAVDLDAHGRLFVGSHHLCDGLPGVADESVRGDELRVDHRSAGFMAQDTEGRVRHVLHRSQKHRLVPEVYGTDFHGLPVARKNKNLFILSM